MKVKHDYKSSVNEVIELDKMLYQSPHGTLTRKILNAICAICGSNSHVEMHHVRKASDIRNQIRSGDSSYQQ